MSVYIWYIFVCLSLSLSLVEVCPNHISHLLRMLFNFRVQYRTTTKKYVDTGIVVCWFFCSFYSFSINLLSKLLFAVVYLILSKIEWIIWGGKNIRIKPLSLRWYFINLIFRLPGIPKLSIHLFQREHKDLISSTACHIPSILLVNLIIFLHMYNNIYKWYINN